MEEDGVKLARRLVVAVQYFMIQVICFTFMAGKPEYNKTILTQIILDGCRKPAYKQRIRTK